MAEYVFDFAEMDGHLDNARQTLNDEITALELEKDSLETEQTSLEGQLYTTDEDGKLVVNEAVKARLDEIQSIIKEINNRIAAYQLCIQESEALILFIKTAMEGIDENYKEVLDSIIGRIEDYERYINEYLGKLDDTVLANDGAVLYTPIQDIKDLLDRNGAGIQAVSDSAILEVKRRLVFDRIVQFEEDVDQLILDGLLTDKIDEYMDISLHPGVTAIMAYTLEDDFSKPKYMDIWDLNHQDVQKVFDDVNFFQSYLGGNFPLIIDTDGSVYFGGAQGWWKDIDREDIANGACGYTAAANILANLALQDPDIAVKLGLQSLNKTGIASKNEYFQLMQDVYNNMNFHYFNQGIPGDELTGIVKSYANSKGVSIDFEQYNAIRLDDNLSRTYKIPTYDFSVDKNDLWDYLNNNLNNNTAIGMSTVFSEQTMIHMDPNGTNTIMQQPNKQHFVTVVGSRTDPNTNTRYLQVSSWGKLYEVSFDEYCENISNAGNTVLNMVDPFGWVSDNFYVPSA